MVLLTFNFKGIEELVGNPPILLDVPDDKVFKDVLLDVIDKLNPLMPEGKKLTLESLGIESFDGEPVSWGTYEKHVFDVIIDFGTSFVVTPKRATLDKVMLDDAKIAEKAAIEKDQLAAFDLTQEVLKTEGVASRDEAEITPSEEHVPIPEDAGLGLGGTPKGGGMPIARAIDRPSLPITPAPSPGSPPPGGLALPATLSLAKSEESRMTSSTPPTTSQPEPTIIEPAPTSMEINAPSQPETKAEAKAPRPSPPMAADEDRREKKKDKAKAFGKQSAPKAAPPMEMEEADEDVLEGERKRQRGESTEPTKTQYDKNISVDYFDVMNPENYYPVVVDIADIEQIWKPVEENIITGERKVQVKEKAMFETDTVTVRPVFPGCTVAPAELEADLTKPKELLTFYVTPLVRGGIKGELHFLANGKIVHITQTPAEVKDPRLARYIFLYGLLASFIPKISQMLNINLEDMLDATIGTSLILGMNLSTFVAVAGTGIAMIIGLVYYMTHKPKGASLRLHLTDFRMTLVPPTIL